MTQGLEKNVPMKDSGVDWIPYKIPLHWNIKKIKHLFQLRDERNYKPLSEVNLISLYTNLGVVQHSDLKKTTGNKAQNADGYKKVYANDIIVNIILCWMGAIGISKYNGVTSPAYDVYKSSDKNILMTLFKGTPFVSEIHSTFLGIPMIAMNYSSTVIPIILAVWFASIVEKWCKKWVPTVVKTFLVPLFTLAIVVPLTFLIIGPIATWIGDALAAATSAIYTFSPILAGVLLGAFWQVFVIFGVHWGFVAVMMSNIAALGYDPILGLTLAASFAQTGVVLGILLQTKDEKLKGIAFPAFISGIFGVTEPAIYGVTLPRKKTFVLSCIGAGIGGGLIGFFGTKTYMMGGMGIFSIPAVIGPKTGMNMSVYGLMIAMLVGFVLGLILQLTLGKNSVDATEAENVAKDVAKAANEAQKITEHKVQAALANDKSYNESTKLVSPLNGEVKPLSEIKDEVFSSGAMGGKALLLNQAKVCLMPQLMVRLL